MPLNSRKMRYPLTSHRRPRRISFANVQFCFALSIGLVFGFILSYMVLCGNFNITVPYWYTKAEMTGEVGDHSRDEEFHKIENSTVADLLFKKVRVLCLVLTQPKNHKKKATHVKVTWGKRCNVLLFMSSVIDESLPTVALNVSEGRNNLWRKTREAFKYVYKNYLDKADWFLKADDDTYVVVENLRYLLMKHNASEPVYFGRRFKPYVKDGYMSGGAGYVLSRNAIERFVEISLKNSTSCEEPKYEVEDINMGMCLSIAQVKAGDSRDLMGRGRFFPLNVENHLIPGLAPEWFFNYGFYETELGMKCCSDSAISFHHIEPSQMYVLEYLIYHLRPYGVSLDFTMPPELVDRPATVGIKYDKNDREVAKNLNKFTPVSFIARNTETLT